MSHFLIKILVLSSVVFLTESGIKNIHAQAKVEVRFDGMSITMLESLREQVIDFWKSTATRDKLVPSSLVVNGVTLQGHGRLVFSNHWPHRSPHAGVLTYTFSTNGGWNTVYQYEEEIQANNEAGLTGNGAWLEYLSSFQANDEDPWVILTYRKGVKSGSTIDTDNPYYLTIGSVAGSTVESHHRYYIRGNDDFFFYADAKNLIYTATVEEDSETQVDVTTSSNTEILEARTFKVNNLPLAFLSSVDNIIKFVVNIQYNPNNGIISLTDIWDYESFLEVAGEDKLANFKK